MGYNNFNDDLFNAGFIGLLTFIIILYLIIFVIAVVANWKIYEKAGREGWISIIPVYNLYVHFEICGKPGWWAFLIFVPLANIFTIVMLIVSQIELAKRFGKSTAFGFGLIFLSLIFKLILAFDDSKYMEGSNEINNYLNDQNITN